MPASLVEVLQLLRYELNWVQQSGYSNPPQAGPYAAEKSPKSPFLENHSCLNFDDPIRRHACHECALSMFVPEEHRAEDIPCHFIPLDGGNVAGLMAEGNRARLAAALQQWLKQKIAHLEALLEKQIVSPASGEALDF